MFDSPEPCSCRASAFGVSFIVPDVVIPKAFIVYEDDALSPSEHQEALATAYGYGLKKFSVNGGHSAFTNVPEEIADMFVQFIKQEKQG